MDDLHINSYLSQYAFFVFAETNERCEVRHKFPTRAQFFPSGDNQLCWTHPGQLRRRVEAHHCEPTSTRWPRGYSIPFSSFSLTQRVIMLRRAFTSTSARRPQGCAPTMLRIGLPGSSIVGAHPCGRPDLDRPILILCCTRLEYALQLSPQSTTCFWIPICWKLSLFNLLLSKCIHVYHRTKRFCRDFFFIVNIGCSALVRGLLKRRFFC